MHHDCSTSAKVLVLCNAAETGMVGPVEQRPSTAARGANAGDDTSAPEPGTVTLNERLVPAASRVSTISQVRRRPSLRLQLCSRSAYPHRRRDRSCVRPGPACVEGVGMSRCVRNRSHCAGGDRGKALHARAGAGADRHFPG